MHLKRCLLSEKAPLKAKTRETLFTFKLHSVQISIQFDEK